MSSKLPVHADDELLDDQVPDENKEQKLEEGGAAEVLGLPPEEDFDEKYNKHLEFPIALVAAVMIHVIVGASLVFLLLVIIGSGPDKSGVPVKLVNLEGLDDAGEGSAGSGGVEDPAFKSDGEPQSAEESLPDPSKTAEVKDEMKQALKDLNLTGDIQPSESNLKQYEQLNKSVREKLLGGRRGAGSEKGSGYDGSKGKGPGGTGADSTLGRNMRWVLRFKVTSGRDYLDQLKAMGGEILIPEPGSDRCTIIEDISNPKNQRLATDDDMRRLADKIKFSDSRPGPVSSVAQALGLGFTPKSFWAFFPKDLEEDLTRKEKAYRGRQPEDIEETIFVVSVRNGLADIRVDDQKSKR